MQTPAEVKDTRVTIRRLLALEYLKKKLFPMWILYKMVLDPTNISDVNLFKYCKNDITCLYLLSNDDVSFI